jgi:hypothetical protein
VVVVAPLAECSHTLSAQMRGLLFIYAIVDFYLRQVKPTPPSRAEEYLIVDVMFIERGKYNTS